MHRKPFLVGALAFLISFAGGVAALEAAATLTQDLRELEIAASVTEGFNSQGIGPISNAPAFGAAYNMVFGSGQLTSSPAGDAQARATATQLSSLDASPIFTSVSAAGTAEANGTVDAFATSADSSGDATSDFVIQFNVANPQAWSITASIMDEGSGSTAYVRLREVGAVTYLFNLSGDGSLNDSDGGVLPAGDYEILGRAAGVGFASSEGAGFYDRDAEFALEFNLIPEPATGALLLACAGLMRRGRRGVTRPVIR